MTNLREAEQPSEGEAGKNMYVALGRPGPESFPTLNVRRNWDKTNTPALSKIIPGFSVEQHRLLYENDNLFPSNSEEADPAKQEELRARIQAMGAVQVTIRGLSDLIAEGHKALEHKKKWEELKRKAVFGHIQRYHHPA